MQKKGRKSSVVRAFIGIVLSGTLMITGMAGFQDGPAMAKELKETKKLATATTPTVITSSIHIKKKAFTDNEISQKNYNTLVNDKEFWIGNNLNMLYAVDQVVPNSSLSYEVYDNSSNQKVESWTGTSWTGSSNNRSYRHTNRELKSSVYKNGVSYTLKVTANISGYTTAVASASFTTYNRISDVRIEGDINTYKESGSKVTLVGSAVGGKGTDYTYEWGYASTPTIKSVDEITLIKGANSSTYTFTLGSESNNRYYYFGAGDGIGGTFIADGVYVREKYKITYSMGPKGNNETLDTDYVNCDAKEGYQIPKLSPSLEGYEFKGWSTSQESTTPEYVGGNTLYPKQNMTLYAIWSYKLILTGDSPVSIIYGKPGKSIINLAQIQPSDASFTFESSKPDVVSVDSDGTVKAKNYGSANITVTAAATDTTEEASIKILVQVKPPKVTKLTYTKKNGKTIIKWKKLKGVKKYHLYYKTKKDKSKWRELTLFTNKSIQSADMRGYKIKVSAEGKGIEGECSRIIRIKK